MQDLTPDGRQRLEAVAQRHGLSSEAALVLLRALAAGGGTMAQFSHPELGGMGQWTAGGMIMLGDMFNHALKARVDAACQDLAALLRGPSPFAAPAASSTGFGAPGGVWWPAGLGAPAASGGQNDLRYAYFPASRRLAIQQGGRTSLYDTGSHQITGVSQQQGGLQSLAFSTAMGPVWLQDLREVTAGGEPSPPTATPAADPPPVAAAPAAGDPLTLIQRLAELHAQGVLTAEEFAAKKAELLARL